MTTHLHMSLETALRNLFFGRPKKGEPAYDVEPTFRTTYPKGYTTNTDEYNRWIRGIHDNERKKFFSKPKK